MAAQVTSLKAHRKRRNKENARGKTLCGRGFHRWQIDQKKQFDVRQGKLVTVERCERCGETRVRAEGPRS